MPWRAGAGILGVIRWRGEARFPGMALSYVLHESPRPKTGRPLTVAVTGAAGRIGAYFAEHAAGRFALRLLVRERDAEAEALGNFGEVLVADLADRAALARAFEGADVVLHLAGNPSPSATWESALEANVVGTYHVFAAAKAAGCGKVVFASSIHAVSGFPADVQVKTTDPVNPGDIYGVSKCFGEALARYMAEREGVDAIALRIGAFQPREAMEGEEALGMMDCFVSRRDLQDLLVRCVEDRRLKFAIFHGVSDNRFKRLDITDARELLGYAPQDDFTEINAGLRELDLSEAVRAQNADDPGQRSGLT